MRQLSWTNRLKKKFLTCRKKNLPLSEKSPQSRITKSLQKIRENWGTFLFVWRFLGFATFCCLRGIQAHNNGKIAWQRPEIQIGQETETTKIHRLNPLTLKTIASVVFWSESALEHGCWKREFQCLQPFNGTVLSSFHDQECNSSHYLTTCCFILLTTLLCHKV